ncbi:hypothetical protein TNCV_304251 [Trichonephila clavipes]|nr:hypothetical protein TNCV_304251 [Trichonephila clavipes]
MQTREGIRKSSPTTGVMRRLTAAKTNLTSACLAENGNLLDEQLTEYVRELWWYVGGTTYRNIATRMGRSIEQAIVEEIYDE